MKKEHKQLNALKAKLLTRDCCIYRDIENELKRLPNKGLKFNYFNRQIDIRQGVKTNAIFADREELIETASAYIKEHCDNTKISDIEKISNQEKLYLLSLFYEYTMQEYWNETGIKLEKSFAIRYFLASPSIESVKEAKKFLENMAYPINQKEEYKKMRMVLSLASFIPLLTPNFWSPINPKSVYVNIDFSQPEEVIIDTIKSIKKIIDNDKHNYLTAKPHEIYSGKFFSIPTKFLEFLKSKEKLFTYEEKLTDLIYIYDCIKIHLPNKHIQKNLYDYYVDKKESESLYDTLRSRVSDLKKSIQKYIIDDTK